jgi:hypothetical protein
VTTFYAYQTRIDVGLLGFGGYVDELRERYRDEFLANPLRGRVTVAEAGGEVLQDRATTQLLYSGGIILAAALDVAIDRTTAREASLDDLLIALVARARRDPAFRLTRETLERELESLTGQSFSPWLDAHVYGHELPELPSYLPASS